MLTDIGIIKDPLGSKRVKQVHRTLCSSIEVVDSKINLLGIMLKVLVELPASNKLVAVSNYVREGLVLPQTVLRVA